MKKFASLSALAVLLTLAACGGGGSGGGTTSAQPLSVTLSSTSGSAEGIEDGAPGVLSFDAVLAGTVPTAAIVDAKDNSNLLASATATPGTAPGSYHIILIPKAGLEPGIFSGTATFRLCQEVACTHVYAGSSASFTYTLSITLKDWAMQGRSADRVSYVPVTLDPSRLSEVWTYEANKTFTPLTTANGMVYFVEAWGDGSGQYSQVAALKAVDGTRAWTYEFDLPLGAEAPVTGDGVVYTVSGHVTDTFVRHFIDGKTGTKIKDITETPGIYSGGRAAVFNGSVYTEAGFGKAVVTGYKLSDGSQTWRQSSAEIVEHINGVAVDDANVYDYADYYLNVYDRLTGTKLYGIDDPYSGPGDAVVGNPPLLAGNHVFVQPYKTGSFGPHINAFDVNTRAALWSSAAGYKNPMAYANGVIYASRYNPTQLDAIDENTGTVLWSWTPPSEGFIPGPIMPVDNVAMAGNIVVTKNLVFVSTSKKLYAIDLVTHATVWSYERPGFVAIGPGNRLYIVVGGYDYISADIRSTGKLVAMKYN